MIIFANLLIPSFAHKEIVKHFVEHFFAYVDGMTDI